MLGRSLSSLSSSPALYVTWALTVVAALCVTYFSNPYVFGFTALALLWVTVAIGILGIRVCLASQPLRTRDRVLIIAALAITAVALAMAFRALGSFRWA